MIILIPAYQPDRKLIDLVAAIGAAAPGVIVLVVDDGSGPDYRAVFAAVKRQGQPVIGYDTNQGKGFALKTGFAHIAQVYPGPGCRLRRLRRSARRRRHSPGGAAGADRRRGNGVGDQELHR